MPKRKHNIYKRVDNRLSTGVEVDDFGGADIMDPPDLFGDLYDDQDEEPQPQGMAPAAPVGAEPRGRAAPRYSPVPRVKDASVELPRSPEIAAALAVADDRGDLVTSGQEGFPGDGVHAPTSQHYKGTALDLRYAPDRDAQQRAYTQAGYVVIPEATHLHVQRYAVA